MNEEVWKDIEGYEGLYQVSNMGRVRSLDRKSKSKNKWNSYNASIKGRIRLCATSRMGYLRMRLCKDGVKQWYQLHQLVARAFIPNPDRKETVNHIDGNKKNNCVSNLEWATQAENNKHARDNHLNNSRKRKVLCVELNKTFESVREASRFIGYISGVHKVCSPENQNKTRGGYHWRYL